MRSPHAHASIDRIDASAALRVPGVVAVWTGADMAKAATTLRVAPPIEGLKPVDLPPFPVDKVRFVGDLVACVVAETRAAAIDGAEAVAVDYDALAAVPDIATARLSSSAPVDPEYQSNLISHQSFAAGDVEAAFAKAAAYRRGALRAAPPDPCADRAARLHRRLGRRPSAPDVPLRQSGAAPVSHGARARV